MLIIIIGYWKELYGIIYHYNYILNNYNIDDNEIITVNEVANIWSNMLKHISFTSGNQV